MIFPVQISAARVLLGISQQELAAMAGIGLGTVKRIEASREVVIGTAQTLMRIQRALEGAGIVFLDQTDTLGPGVRLLLPLQFQ